MRPLWAALPLEDRDEGVPETMELPPGKLLSQDTVFKKHCSRAGAGIPESTLEETASKLREGLSRRRKWGGPSGMTTESQADRLLCKHHST